jgi:hypothetical protein
MKIFVSPKDGRIHTSEKLKIQCWCEYGHKNLDIPTSVKEMTPGTYVDELLLIPITHIDNPWHLFFHLYITFKFMKGRKYKHVYPIFFPGFYHEKDNMLNSQYVDLIFTGMGFSLANCKELHDVFHSEKAIDTPKITIPDGSINFKTEQSEMESFKQFIMNNFHLEYKISDMKNITFVLRRGSRKITNLEYVQTQFSNFQIRYVYLEDFTIREQLDMIANTDIYIGVHGAGLTWSFFMKPNSRLIEIYPGNPKNECYRQWCTLTGLKYKRIIADISSGISSSFRGCDVQLNSKQINEIRCEITDSV